MLNPKILVVDDEEELADLYWAWISEKHDADKAYSGTEALDTVDDTYDIVFLDRRIPDISGQEILSKIRGRGLECWVVMVTAVDPKEEILDMEFDAYLSKPVTQNDLLTAVEEIKERAEYNEKVREYTATMSKINALNQTMDESRRDSSPFYKELVDHAEMLKQELSTTVDHFEGSVFNIEEIEVKN